MIEIVDAMDTQFNLDPIVISFTRRGVNQAYLQDIDLGVKMNIKDGKKLVLVGIHKRGQWGFRFKSSLNGQKGFGVEDLKKQKKKSYQDLKTS